MKGDVTVMARAAIPMTIPMMYAETLWFSACTCVTGRQKTLDISLHELTDNVAILI